MDKDPNRVKDLHFNDISISACESGEHLGNWIGRNCNSVTYIDRTITEFNCLVNYISSTFSFTPFDVKLQLFNTYCMPKTVLSFGILVIKNVRNFIHSGI